MLRLQNPRTLPSLSQQKTLPTPRTERWLGPINFSSTKKRNKTPKNNTERPSKRIWTRNTKRKRETSTCINTYQRSSTNAHAERSKGEESFLHRCYRILLQLHVKNTISKKKKRLWVYSLVFKVKGGVVCVYARALMFLYTPDFSTWRKLMQHSTDI